MKLLLSLIILLYNLSILVGTAYLVDVRDWNPWWFLFSIVCLMTIDLREKKQKIFGVPGIKSVDLNTQIDDNVYTVNKQGNKVNIIREMREAGLTKSEMVGEIIAGVSVIAFPVLILFVAYVFGK